MKHLQTFESFLNEDRAVRVTVDASLWKDKKPVERKLGNENYFCLFSQPITDDQTWGNTAWGQPGMNLIVFQILHRPGQEQCWIKIGGGKGSGQPNDDNKDSDLGATYGDNVPATIEEMKTDPTGVAKKAAAIFVNAKRGFDMNYEVGTQLKRAIFKIANDLDKPLAELIEFTAKNIR
jgi:hypothetical protein